MDLNALFGHAVESGAGDVHLNVGQPPVSCSDGELAPAPDRPAAPTQTSTWCLRSVTAEFPRRRDALRNPAAAQTVTELEVRTRATRASGRR